MNEEELFCKLFPEYAVNGKPLSPYFDLFESGYEQAEKRIAELEKRCANYEMTISKMEKGTCDICKETEKDKKILDLEKENAELKKINADALSELNHINGDLIIENEKLRKEIAELKELLKDKSCLDCNHLHSDLKLTKAKELLERLLITSCNSDVLNLLPNCSEVLRVRVEAEQFLSEVEK